tara:strand:- start:4619 stop:4987 length:369 start_codon:yes stop_codon:yes gene_type:complete
MSWTLDTALSHIRDLLKDTQADAYRHSSAKILRVTNVALVEARKLRPDLFIPSLVTYSAPTLTTADLGQDPQTPLPIDDMYFMPIVEYVVGFVSMEDDEFVIDGRAVQLLNRFSQKMIGKGA